MKRIVYLINKDHFKIEEIDFEKLKSYTNNVILEYNQDFTFFKRALFELDRLGFNIGIKTSSLLFFDLIKGFNIKLGIWIEDNESSESFKYLRKFKDNFIVGYISDEIYRSISPRWGTMGDIENAEIIKLDFIREPIQQLIINTDYVKIYDENHLRSIPRG